jgi:hypothetical protein
MRDLRAPGTAFVKRSNRLVAANRAEETHGGRIVARWYAALLKTDNPMVHLARC